MSLKNSLLFAAIGIVSISSFASASITCDAGSVSGSQESACASFDIPDLGTLVSMNFSCKGFEFHVDCDSTTQPIGWNVAITGPNGIQGSAATNVLKVVDHEGNGAFIRCSDGS